VSIGALGAATYSGVLTPSGSTYQFGGGGGALTINNALTLGGTNSVTVGLGSALPAAAANPLSLWVTAAESYSGPTIIRSGGIDYVTVANGGGASGLGLSSNAAANLVLDGGTLSAAGSTDRLFTLTGNGGTIDNRNASFTNTGPIALPSGVNVTLTLSGADTNHNQLDATIADPSGGKFSIIKNGSGKWTFNSGGNKTYSGDTHVVAGTLEELSSNAYSANSNTVIEAGAALDFHDNSATINGLSGAGSVFNSFASHTRTFTIGAANGSGTFSGSISSGATLNLVKTGTGTQVFSGANNYAGSTTIAGGVLVVDNSAALGTAAYAIVFSGGTLGYTANSAAAGAQDYASRFANSAKAINIDTGGQTVVFAGSITNSNTAGLVKVGAGTLVLSGTNKYTGGTIVEGGALVLTNNQAVADGSNLTVGSGIAAFAPIIGGSEDASIPSDGAAVPEPATLTLLIAAAIMAGVHRRCLVGKRRALRGESELTGELQ
jgi:autotransporter-associated beta strand protein